MQKPDVHSFSDAASFMAAMLKWLKLKNPQLSIRWLSRRFGLKSHSIVLRYLDGTSLPKQSTAARIVEIFQLTDKEAVTFFGLCDLPTPGRRRAKRDLVPNDTRPWLAQAIEEAMHTTGACTASALRQVIIDGVTEAAISKYVDGLTKEAVRPS